MKKTLLKRYLLEIENEIRITVVEKIINGHPLILFHKRSRALSIFSIITVMIIKIERYDWLGASLHPAIIIAL